MNTILKIQGLTKRFGSFLAVHEVSFEIQKGYVYGLLGPNGSGKSTTLGMVLGVVNKSAGEYVWFDGKLQQKEALKKVGAIIERPSFYPYMSAYQNLKLVCKIKQISEEVIDEKLSLVGLLGFKNRKFETFSLGMKQRLAIASALLNNPEILILDEPTNGLDPQGIHQIRTLIQQLVDQGITVLLASHLLDEVEKVCTHVIVLQKGKVLYSGRVDEMIAEDGFFELACSNNKELENYLRGRNDVSNILIDKEILKVFFTKNIEASTLNEELMNQNIIVSHLVKRTETLEDKFLKITHQ